MRKELLLLQNLDNKKLDFRGRLKAGFAGSRKKEDYYDEIQKKIEHAQEVSGRHSSLSMEDLQTSADAPFRRVSSLRPSDLGESRLGVSARSRREDIEHSIRVKIEGIEKTFREVVGLPTTRCDFEQVG